MKDKTVLTVCCKKDFGVYVSDCKCDCQGTVLKSSPILPTKEKVKNLLVLIEYSTSVKPITVAKLVFKMIYFIENTVIATGPNWGGGRGGGVGRQNYELLK